MRPRRRKTDDFVPARLEVRKSKEKGRCIYAQSEIRQGEMFLQYDGTLLENEPCGDDTYVFEFYFKRKRLWIDATEENGSLGRLVNDSHKSPNCKVKVIETENKQPSLWFVALRDIHVDEEILYDYGNGDYPWRKKKRRKDVDEPGTTDVEPGNTDFGNTDLIEHRSTANIISDSSKIITNSSTFVEEEGQHPMSVFGLVLMMKDDQEMIVYPISSDVTSFGSAKSNDIVVSTAIAHEALLEVNMSGKVFLVDCNNQRPSIHLLQDNESFKVGEIKFRWKYTHSDDVLEPGSTDPGSTNVEPGSTYAVKSGSTGDDEDVDKPGSADIVEPQSTVLVSPDATKSFSDLYTLEEKEGHHLNSDVLEPGITDPGSTNVEPGSTYAVKSRNTGDDEDVDKPGSADIVEPQCTVLVSPDATKSFSDLYTLEEKEGHHLNSDVLEPGSTDPGSTNVEPGSTYAVKSGSTGDDEDVDKPGSADIVEPQSTVLVSPDATKSFSDLYTLEEKEGHHLNSVLGLYFEEHFSSPESEDNLDTDYLPDSPVTDSEEDETLSESEYESHIGAVGMNFRKLLNYYDNPESDTSEIIPPMELRRDFTKKTKITQVQNSSVSSTSSSEIVIVQQTNNSGKRKWDKIHFCLFCDDYSSTNIRKHYFGPHKREAEVKRILDIPLNSKQRKLAIEKLRNAGDYKHNTKVLKEGKGVFITWARNSTSKSPKDYLPCEFCLAFFLRSTLWRHQKSCSFNNSKKKNRKVQSEAELLLPTSVQISDGLKEAVISRMVADEVSIAVRNEPIIIKVAEKLYQSGRYQSSHISQVMRQLGRFLIEARKHDADILQMRDIIRSGKFLLAVQATKSLCRYDENNNRYLNPSLAVKLGQHLKKCASVLRTEALILDDEEQKKRAEDFRSLCEEEWGDAVTSKARQTLNSNKMNKGPMLPLSEDIMKLQSYLQQNTEILVNNLSESFSKADWDTLNQMTLAQVVLFNRRRGGETQRMTLEAYQSRTLNTQRPPKEVEDSLSEAEKVLLTTMPRVEIKGKRGRTVPVLLTQSMQKRIDILLKWRPESTVDKENHFLFPRPNFGSKESLRSADVLRRFAQESRLKCPQNITSTRLRKHVATVTQILNLDKHDLEIMASFMGHDIAVHRSFYRLPQETLQVAKMGRLLTAFNNGTVGQYSGKSIDDISLDVDELLSSDDNEEDDIDEDNNDYEEIDENDGSKDKEHILENCRIESREARSTDKHTAVSCVAKSSADRSRKIQKLSDEQSKVLRRLFSANVTCCRELKRHECEKAIRDHTCLNELSWKKVKNTIHNWITTEKRKQTKFN